MEYESEDVMTLIVKLVQVSQSYFAAAQGSVFEKSATKVISLCTKTML